MIDCTQYCDHNHLRHKNVDLRRDVWTILDRFFNENNPFTKEEFPSIDNKRNDKLPTGSDLNCGNLKDNDIDILKDIKIEHENTIVLFNKIDLLQKDVADSLTMQVGVCSANACDISEEVKTNSNGKENNQKKGDLENSDKFVDSLNSNNSKDLRFANPSIDKLTVCSISCVTGKGMEEFISVLRDKVANM